MTNFRGKKKSESKFAKIYFVKCTVFNKRLYDVQRKREVIPILGN